MIRELIRTFGTVRVTVLATLFAVGLSVTLTAGLDLLLKGRVVRADLVIGSLVPLLVAPVIVYGFVRLTQRLDRAEAELQRLASRDHLTGAYTRRHFRELAHLEMEQSRRSGHPLALLLFDIDHFKRVNDEFGHATGDEVLRELVRTCRRCLRTADLLGRHGGEEFTVLLPETSPNAARYVGERIRRETESAVVREGEAEIRCTVSVGVAALTAEMEGVDELIEDADRALYAAKRAGRNRVESSRRLGSG